MNQVIWISYDLSVKGDYEGLYAWLDDHNAEECGNSVAFLHYEYRTDLLSELKDDLSRNVNLETGPHIYHLERESENERPILVWQEKVCSLGRFWFSRASGG